ncbi:hypothetical protein BDV93DRAFT_516934 [Ceratobasidium sp. AG-I]|nr:hypothetical protein BDV93DRAFT_516934 [Ceratobasidium sp. AG-I]
MAHQSTAPYRQHSPSSHIDSHQPNCSYIPGFNPHSDIKRDVILSLFKTNNALLHEGGLKDFGNQKYVFKPVVGKSSPFPESIKRKRLVEIIPLHLCISTSKIG